MDMCENSEPGPHVSSSIDIENRTENDEDGQRLLAEVWNSMTTFMCNIHTHIHIHRNSLCYFWRARLSKIMKIQARSSHNTGGLVDSRMERGRKSSGEYKGGEKLGGD